MSDGYERRLSELYRASAQEEPPASIDSVILAAARREARGSTRIAIRWGVPLALAAVVVLSVSLVTMMRDVSELGGNNVNVDKQRQRYPAAPEADRSVFPAKELEQRREIVSQERTNTTGPKPSEVAEPERHFRDQAEGASTSTLTKESAAPAPVSAPADTVPAPPVSSVERQNPTAPPRSDAAKSEAPQTAPVRAPARAGVNPYGTTGTSSEKGGKSKALAEERSAQDQAKAVGAVAEKVPQVRSLEDNELPEQWLKRIEQLRKDGKVTEAQASLDEFRKRFPAYPLPEGLK